MLYINEEIEQLFQLIENPCSYKGKNLFNRMQAWAILSMFNDINNSLERIDKQLDKSLSYDALGIDFDFFLDAANSLRKKLPTIAKNSYISNTNPQNYQSQINRMTDYLPNGVLGYDVTSDVVGSFKTAMHQLCDEDRISTRTLEATLDRALDTLCMLLNDIKKKVEHPESYLYINLWEDLEEKYSNSLIQEEYQKWVDENNPDFDDLKNRQKQEIYELLTSGFFRFCPQPTGGAVKKRNLIITEDDLAVGTKIPDGFDVECTKFEKFIEWKVEHILTLNYEKLGQYIYRNYRNLKESSIIDITYFDSRLDLIQEDMAKYKPELAQYLKRYQEHQDEELLNDVKKAFEPFKDYLKDDIRQTIIDEYLEKLLFDSELREEAKKKLSGQSKKKYCCSIVLALCSCYIFNPELTTNKTELAKILNKGLAGENKDTLIRYLKDSTNDNKKLTSWTNETMDDLKGSLFPMAETG